jgi:1-aminocyclopropane-1-carboxylate deaminase/D-cysteine desulfhydrase-like pyridoxal-dependent ACC family enzyme
VIGQYPTPVRRLAGLSTDRSELWVKRDDLTSDVYGGNKVRKLERILEAARARGARRLVTFGTAGSHQALATTVHGTRAGFEVAAVLAPQPRTDYAVDVLRAGLTLGLQAFPAASFATVPLALARLYRRGDFIIDPGGSSIDGTMGYIDAALELEDQVRTGALPRPDAIVVPFGSAGTAAGLTAGLVELGAATRVVAVRIVGPALIGKQRALWLAHRTARRRGFAAPLASLARSLEVERGYLGRGYGHSTEAGQHAASAAAREGLSLDVTYTAKAFAAALDLVASARFRNVLYWHTLSSTPLAPLVERAPPLPAELDRLFTPQ